MNDENGGNGHECGDECGHDADSLPMAMEFEAAGNVLLGMREQNVELLRIASQVAGYGGGHTPLKPSDLRHAINAIWEVYSQFYQWVDPEDTGDEEDEGEGDEE